MSTQPKAGPASGLSSEEQRRRAAVRNLPAPQPGMVVTVPLPLYMELHRIEPKLYRIETRCLIVKKQEPE